MDDRVHASLLWGAVGALAFLVFVQGYALVGDVPVSFLGRLGLGLAVGAVTAAASYRLDAWFAARASE